MNRLQELRLAAGVSQGWLADKLGVTPTQISSFEAGRTGIKAERLKQIADAFQVPISYFYGSDQLPSDWMTPAEIELIRKLRILPGQQVAVLLQAVEKDLATTVSEASKQANDV
ncbi:hypothetical protein ASG43_20630 [Aureimonas sp. Leaf454]|nr:helix-turn-helix transcriptional regulator [Aureimonas sp. Leaf454]KQT51988.1 hypothetical protein ASG43_20630 [Aureimonas sp. Leaf454]